MFSQVHNFCRKGSQLWLLRKNKLHFVQQFQHGLFILLRDHSTNPHHQKIWTVEAPPSAALECRREATSIGVMCEKYVLAHPSLRLSMPYMTPYIQHNLLADNSTKNPPLENQATKVTKAITCSMDSLKVVFNAADRPTILFLNLGVESSVHDNDEYC
uniref:Uncharacterized protein n=1 Tax=Romanomermis culicivorax TaxID=13658 RepID=A0A915L1V9_ROMCU